MKRLLWRRFVVGALVLSFLFLPTNPALQAEESDDRVVKCVDTHDPIGHFYLIRAAGLEIRTPDLPGPCPH